MGELETTYRKAIDLISKCATSDGFLASNTNIDNYRRIFARDGIIIGFSALMSGDKKFIKYFEKTLISLKKYQGPLGEIPSNIDFNKNQVSFGRTTGRVDATLWYVIGNIQYYKRTNDLNFLKKQMPSITKCIQLLNCWEFNGKHLIYVPLGGDWADEYVNQGYVLYDELLYLKAIEDYADALKIVEKPYESYSKKAKILRKMIKINFWPEEKNKDSKYVYHTGMFELMIQNKKDGMFVSSFYPGGFNDKFDSFANSLALLFGVADEIQTKRIMQYVKKTFDKKTKYMFPAFTPAIKKNDVNWSILKTNYNFRFKNEPDQFHNGGFWPLTTAFMAMAINKTDNLYAKKYLDGIISSVKTGEYGFYEYLDGNTFEPKGTRLLGFSAAAIIMAHQSILNGKKMFL